MIPPIILPSYNDFYFANIVADPLSTPSRHLREKKIAEWQNMNSFFARLASEDFFPWIQLPFQELRNAFEFPPSSGRRMESRIWVANEWIMRCGNMLFRRMLGGTADERLASSLATGPLCRHIRPLCEDRWRFWQTRIALISHKWEDLELSRADCLRMGALWRKMLDIDDTERHIRWREQGY